MKKIFYLAILSLTLSAPSPARADQSRQLECASHYVNGQSLEASFSATLAGNAQLLNYTLTVGGEDWSRGRSATVDPTYRPIRYKGFSRFNLKSVTASSEITVVSILLPNQIDQLDEAQAIIQVSGAEGGSTSKFHCEIK